MKKFYLSILLLFAGLSVLAQPIGEWNDHLPYSSAVAVANGAEHIYSATPYSYFLYHKKDNFTNRRSKANGLTDIGIATLEYNIEKQILLVAYTNANIDIVTKEKVINMADIKNSNIAGAKNINDIFFQSKYAYLSTSFGIVVVDLERYEVKDTYIIGPGGIQINVNAVTSDGNFLYAATESGVYKASLIDGSNLLSYTNWYLQNQGIPISSTSDIVNFKGKIYTAIGDSLFTFENNTWSFRYSTAEWEIINLSTNEENIVAVEHFEPSPGSVPADTRLAIIDETNVQHILTNNELTVPLDALRTENGNYFIADLYKGLIKYTGTAIESIIPNGPFTTRVYDIATKDNSVYIAPGGANQSFQFTFNQDGFFQNTNGWWLNYNQYSHPELSGIYDIMTIAPDPLSDKVYFGSFLSGIVVLENGELSFINKDNSKLTAPVSDPARTTVVFLTFDENGNLWISNYGTEKPLAVLTADGEIYKYTLPQGLGSAYQIAIDDFGQKWIVITRNDNVGLVVYDENNTFGDVSDDRSVVLSKNLGGLHINEITCIAADKDGEIWAGSKEGVMIFYCPGQIMDYECAPSRPLVEIDGYLGYLLETETINAIEVDGANRKWIGTENGVWLMNEDGTEAIEYFTEENSPLFSNNVTSIEVDDQTGVVYFGTDKGLISYKGTATEGGEIHENVMVYPNPVREDYKGPIAIKGLVRDANVKITDISGRLIHETTALGGQAIWDGRNYNGMRAKTGVYLIFSTNEDGTETMVSKLLFIN